MAVNKRPRICISAGHGIGSRIKGKQDPGASMKGTKTTEAEFVLNFSKKIVANFERLFQSRYKGFVMLRNGGLYYRADDAAYANACDMFIEFHLNAGGGTGVEVLYEDAKDRAFAANLSADIAEVSGLRDRGAKHRGDLAVLEPKAGMTQVLVELFFADNTLDQAKFRGHSKEIERAIVNRVLRHWGWRPVKGLPRTFSKARLALYRGYK